MQFHNLLSSATLVQKVLETLQNKDCSLYSLSGYSPRGWIVMTSGENSSGETSNEARVLNYVEGKWLEVAHLPKLNKSRSKHSSVILGDSIYVFFGS